MRRLLFVASMVLPALGCGSDPSVPPPLPASRWSAAQSVGPAFEVAPYYVTVHSPAWQKFTPPRVAWADGTAVAVWSDLWRGIWTARLGSTGGWTPPISIASPNRVPPSAGSCSPFPCTGRPPVGEVTALVALPGGVEAFWEQTPYTDAPGIWSAVSPPSGAWSAPQGQHALPPGSVQGPVAKAAAGQAIVAWQLTGNEDSSIWAQRYGAGAPLDTATRLRSGDRVWLSPPAVDVDAAGTAVVIWGGLDGVHARWFSAASGWGPDRMLPRANVDCSVVALDGAGGAIAAWREVVDLGAPSDAWITVTRLRPDTGWGAPESLSVPESRSGCPAIASAPSGHALVVWPNAGTSRGLWARALGTAAGTAARMVQEVDAAHEITSLRVSMDGGGNGDAAWIRARTDTSVTGTYSVRPPSGTVWASHFVNGGAGWDAPLALQRPSSTPADVATMVDVAVGADGSVVAFWFEFSQGLFTPWAARASAR